MLNLHVLFADGRPDLFSGPVLTEFFAITEGSVAARTRPTESSG